MVRRSLARIVLRSRAAVHALPLQLERQGRESPTSQALLFATSVRWLGSYPESVRGSRGGKVGGWTRRSRSSQRPASAVTRRSPRRSAASAEPVVARELDDEDEETLSATMSSAIDAVEAAGLGVRPGVERPDDLAAAVGVGAARLARAGVADVRRGRGSGRVARSRSNSCGQSCSPSGHSQLSWSSS